MFHGFFFLVIECASRLAIYFGVAVLQKMQLVNYELDFFDQHLYECWDVVGFR